MDPVSRAVHSALNSDSHIGMEDMDAIFQAWNTVRASGSNEDKLVGKYTLHQLHDQIMVLASGRGGGTPYAMGIAPRALLRLGVCLRTDVCR